MSEEEKFAALQAKLEKDPAEEQAFEQDPLPQLKAAGILLLPTIAAPVPAQTLLHEAGIELASSVGMAAARLAAAEKISARKHWWGVDVVMNEKLTQDVIIGLEAGGPLGTLIGSALAVAGIVTGGVATLIGAAFAAILCVKKTEIKIVDNGEGVHWPISWLQWLVLLNYVPMGPAGIVAAGMVIIHPVRN
jgi:hypothetical protein